MGPIENASTAQQSDKAVVQAVEKLATATHRMAQGQTAQRTQAAAQQAQQVATGQTAEKEKRTYNSTQRLVLKGFCGVDKLSQVPKIWGSFQKALGVETHRDNIRVMMEAWSAAHIEPIDAGVYLTKTQIDDILNM